MEDKYTGQLARNDAYFARKEMDMLSQYYGNNEASFAIKMHQLHKRAQKEREKRNACIKEIMEKFDVPERKAEIYYYYTNITEKFLLHREERRKRNFKNEIKCCFNKDFEDEFITMIDWVELYEILEPIPYYSRDLHIINSELYLKNILKVITEILDEIELIASEKEGLPPDTFDKRLISYDRVPIETSDFIIRNLGGKLSKIEEAMKRYLLTELPEGSLILLDFFEERESHYLGSETIAGGFSRYVVDNRDYTYRLYVKPKILTYGQKK